jgi:hypothetical protein
LYLMLDIRYNPQTRRARSKTAGSEEVTSPENPGDPEPWNEAPLRVCGSYRMLDIRYDPGSRVCRFERGPLRRCASRWPSGLVRGGC